MNYTNRDFYSRICRLEDISVNFTTIHQNVTVNSSKNVGCVNNQQPIAGCSKSFVITSGTVGESSHQSRAISAAPDNGGGLARLSKSTSTANISSENSHVIVAITEGRGHAEGEIGLAAMDINSPSLIVSQISDAFLYRDALLKLKILNPSEIIIPLTVFNSGSKFFDEIKNHFHNVTITPVPRRHFAPDPAALEQLVGLCLTSCKNVFNFLDKKFYAQSAAIGLLAYVKVLLAINFIPNSLKIEYQNRSYRMFIDFESYHRLELLYSLVDTREKRCCLYGFLNNTVTAPGSRCLRAYILEPYCHLQDIYDTQECIKELLEDSNLLLQAHELLKRFSCCDQLLKLSILPPEDDKPKSIEIILNRVLLLKSTLENLPQICCLLKNCRSELFIRLAKVLSDTRFEIMLTEIRKIIQPEVHSIRATSHYFQRIYAIKSGICNYLDMMRTIYSNLVDNIKSTISELSARLEIPLRMTYSVSKGFHMHLPSTKKNHILNIPPELDVIYQRGDNYYVTNKDLYMLNLRVKDVIEELHRASYRISRTLVETLLKNADVIYELVGAVSTLDIILSLAKVSSKDGYCCPKFGSDTRIIDAVYPFLEYTSAKPNPVPNNIIGTPEFNFYLITGPNMGGKTLYIKTIALLQIMAQLGCFIPAKEATFRICDRIFTRMGYENRVEKDSSNHVKEMKEFQYILNNISPRSLVLIDEICRNTNAEEGKHIAFQICKKLATMRGIERKDADEKMANTSKTSKKNTLTLIDLTLPFIYLTTHFLEITGLIDDYTNISNLHLHAEQDIIEGKLHLTYTHKLALGVTPIRGYGLALARTVRFPRGILERADEIYKELVVQEKNHLQMHNSSSKSTSNPIIAKLEASLKSLPIQNQMFNTSLKLVTSFLNRSTTISPSHNSTVAENRNKSAEISEKFYDLFSLIISAMRSDITDYVEKCDKIIENFIREQPKELLDNIKEIDSEQFGSLISGENTSVCTDTSKKQSDDAKKATNQTSLMNLSYHSLLRRVADEGREATSVSTQSSTGSVHSWLQGLAGECSPPRAAEKTDETVANIQLQNISEGDKISFTFPAQNKSTNLNANISTQVNANTSDLDLSLSETQEDVVVLAPNSNPNSSQISMSFDENRRRLIENIVSDSQDDGSELS